MDKIEKSALRSLFWKDEILQIMYWMNGEGLGSSVPASQILALLNTSEDNLLYHLEKMSKEGVLSVKGTPIDRNSKFSLSSSAKKVAGQRFAEAFQGFQKAGHGECGPDCEFCYGPNGTKLENCVHNCGHQN